jgi:hypothetical protein
VKGSEEKTDILVSARLVSFRRGPTHIRAAGLTDSLSHEFWEDGDVGDVAGCFLSVPIVAWGSYGLPTVNEGTRR